MDVLNKYDFMDYFKMKDQIRRFTSNNVDWSTFTDIYFSRITSVPMYNEYCSSPKKLLNIIDVMLSVSMFVVICLVLGGIREEIGCRKWWLDLS